MIGLDTNVLLRLLLRDDEAQAAAALRFVEGACSAEAPCLINRIVLVEAAWVLASGYGYGREQVAAILDAVLRTEVFAVENAAEAWAALKDYRAGERRLRRLPDRPHQPGSWRRGDGELRQEGTGARRLRRRLSRNIRGKACPIAA